MAKSFEKRIAKEGISAEEVIENGIHKGGNMNLTLLKKTLNERLLDIDSIPSKIAPGYQRIAEYETIQWVLRLIDKPDDKLQALIAEHGDQSTVAQAMGIGVDRPLVLSGVEVRK